LEVSEVLDGLKVLEGVSVSSLVLGCLLLNSSLLTTNVVIVVGILPAVGVRILIEVVDHTQESEDVLISGGLVSSGCILAADHTRVLVGSGHVGASQSSGLVAASSSSLNHHENRRVQIAYLTIDDGICSSIPSSPSSSSMMTMAICLRLLHCALNLRLGRGGCKGDGCTAEKDEDCSHLQ
ncbi:hypothetical protein PENTCL1PPCAC_26390, partial [Pristionchus entomophagus]